MTNNELLSDINSPNFMKSRTLETPYKALGAVVRLHKSEEVTLPNGEWGIICSWCSRNGGYSLYPCLTIEAIEKELK